MDGRVSLIGGSPIMWPLGSVRFSPCESDPLFEASVPLIASNQATLLTKASIYPGKEKPGGEFFFNMALCVKTSRTP